MKRALLALTLAACGTSDPCDGKATCITLEVTSKLVHSIDALEVDVLYGDVHSTVTTQNGTHVEALPVDTALVLDISDPVTVGVVAAGKLNATVLGIGAAQVAIAPHDHKSLPIALIAPEPCPTGMLLCGNDMIVGDPMTLYGCDDSGVPLARGVCEYGCITRTAGDTCRGGGGTCQPGAYYCGGDKLDGDPETRYVCGTSGNATMPMHCANGCEVRPGFDDQCR